MSKTLALVRENPVVAKAREIEDDRVYYAQVRSAEIMAIAATYSPGGTAVSTFLALTDSPGSYDSAAGFLVKVNNTEDGLIFEAGAGGAVDSVFGRTGVITATSGDYDAGEITETATRVFVTPAQKTAIGTNTTNIATNVTDIATNSTAIATNATNIATNTSDIADNVTDIATNATNIATNVTNIATNVTAIATNATNIATNTSDIADNVTDIATNTTNIATNTSNISTNSTGIANNVTAITLKQDDVVTTRGDIVRGDSSGDAERLALGTNGQVLSSNGTDIVWANATGFADPMSTRGDIIIRGSGGTTRLALGATNQVLTSDGTDVTWANAASGFSDPMTTRGDLIFKNASGTTTRLPAGTNGQVLTSDGTDVAWQNAASGFADPMTTRGDLIFKNASNTTTRLPVGTAGQILTSDGTDASWSDPATAGDVTAASAFANDNRMVKSDGTGKGVQATGITVDDSNNISGIGTIGSGAITPSNLTADRVVQAGTGGVIETSTVTNTELGYVSGVTSAIQTQISGNDTDIATNAANIATNTSNIAGKQDDVVTTRGDIVRGDASGEPERLALGTSGQLLTSNGTDAVWSDPATAGDVTAASAFANDNRMVKSDGTGKGVQATGITVDDSNNISGLGTISSGAITPSNLTADRVIQAGTGGIIETSAVTNTELGYVSGVTSAIQTQLNANASAITGKQDDVVTTRGDIVTTNVSGDPQRLALGTANQVLTSDGTDAIWAAAVGFADPMTTRGDIIYKDAAGTTTRLAAGASGQVLTSDGTDIAWQNAASGFSDPMTTRGDLIFKNASNTTTRLPVGTANQVLTSDGTDVSWAATGDVTAASNFATDNRLLRSDGVGKGAQSSDITVDDSDNVSGITSVDVDGTTEATSTTTGAIKTAGGIGAVKNIVAGGQSGAEINDAGNSGAALTIDWNNGNVQFVDMTGNVTFTLSNPISGFAYTLVLKQDATGSRTATWPAAVQWPGGVAPTLSTGANAIDIVTLVYNGLDTEYYAVSQLDFS